MNGHHVTRSRSSGPKIVLLGAPGAGKGTQANELVQYLHCPHISTGEILRAVIQSDSLIGSKIRNQVETGMLVSDELVMDLAVERLNQRDARIGFILDGIPRTIQQAKMLDERLEHIGSPIDCCILLIVDVETIFERLAARARVEHRADDAPATIRERLAIFERDTAPLVEYFRTRDQLIEVAGAGTFKEVTARILRRLSQAISIDAGPSGQARSAATGGF